jgi:hypothetical protein
MLLTVDPLVTLISSPYFGQCQNEFIRYDHKADLLQRLDIGIRLWLKVDQMG